MPSFKIIGLLVLEMILKAIYSHGGHLGHVTLTSYTNFHSLFLRMLHIKFGFDWPWQAVSEKKIFKYHCNIHVYCPGVGADRPLGYKFFQNHQS